MKKLLTILFTICILASTFAQDAKIATFPVTPYMIAHGEIDTSVYKSTYTGLKTVGIGDLVYLVSANPATVFTWSFSSRPAGSAAAFDNTVTPMVTFRADVAGEYVVKLAIDGTTDEMTFVAGTYLGNTSTACAPCHNGTIDEMTTTGHSTILIRGVEGTLSGHYGEGCISCHTVGYNTDAQANNGGFDDIQAQVGWMFPAHPAAGEWAAMDPALQAVGNIQCENCHGPASEHIANGFNPAKMDVSLDSWMCAKCHDDGHYHRRPNMWKESGHSRSASISGASRGGCADCHEGASFIAMIDETPGNNPADLNNPEAIGCAVCHDPHDSHDNHDPMLNSAGQEDEQQHNIRKLEDVVLTNGFELNFGGSGRLCVNCHKGRRVAEDYVDGRISSHFGPHHSNQGDMILGENVIDFGRYLASSTHRDVMPDLCVTCHMAETPGGRSGWDEYGRDKVGDHSFAMHWAGDDGISGNEDDVYNVGVCQDCHGESIKTFEDFVARKDYDHDGNVESVRDELHGLMEEVDAFFPKTADGGLDTDNNNPAWRNPVLRRALFNYVFVEDDHSFGMHNFQFAVNLLQVTLDALNYGVLVKGEILEIADVPNDQGKQVVVKWNRFGGDGASNDPLTTYMVFRADELTPKANPKFTSFDEIPGELAGLKPGDVITDDHLTWVYVGGMPAAQLFEYAMVAPTVYDATPADTVMTAFKVVGVTRDGISASTDAAEGFSVDNLAPMVPTNFLGAVVNDKVELTWDEPVDEDFQYFAVYRGTESGFDASAMAPYATTIETMFVDSDLQVDVNYYYVVNAVDFSGNKGDFAAEISFSITDVASELSGIPADFNLQQNYPNPFNPTTEIRFGVPENANVKIVIYNAVGKEVAQLVNKHFNAGYHTYTWNAANLASGVYFYEMTSNKFKQTQKMLLVK